MRKIVFFHFSDGMNWVLNLSLPFLLLQAKNFYVHLEECLSLAIQSIKSRNSIKRLSYVSYSIGYVYNISIEDMNLFYV